MLIGLDFDNTLICYDRAFSKVGKQAGLLAPDTDLALKSDVKHHLMTMDPSGVKWETLQGLVYGKCIDEAVLFDGVESFVHTCREHGIDLKIISHKTLLAHHDPDETNLRTAALGWMDANGFFSNLGFSEDAVLFGATREEKLGHIKRENCTVFIDDLPEVLLDPLMPSTCRTILFRGVPSAHLEQYDDWHCITEALDLQSLKFVAPNT